MLKALKFRMYPTSEQKHTLNQFIGTSRFIYNTYLFQKIEMYKNEKKNYSLIEMKKSLKDLQTKYVWLKEIDGSILRTTLDDLDKAYDRFYKQKNGYPNYKRKSINGSYRTTFLEGQYKGKTYQNIKLDLENKKIKLPKIKEEIKIRGYRHLKTFKEKILNATVSKIGNRYYVSLCIDENTQPIPFTPKRIIGLDLGIKDIVVTSDGLKYKNEQNIKKYEKKIKGLQRWLQRCQKGSKNRLKVQMKLQRVYQKLKNARKFLLHRISKEIVENNDIVVTEKLKITNMIKNHNLAKAIQDSSWYELKRQLEYKCKWQNKKYYEVNTYYASSQECNRCGKKNEKVKDLNVREWTCENCGLEHDRDINASINIMYEGLLMYAKEQLV